MGLFEKLGFGLKKTKEGIFNSITKSIISSPLTDELYDDLLEQLILADVGYEVSEYLCDQLRTEARKRKAKSGEDVVKIFQDIVVELLSTDKEFDLSGDPAVILVIGVNGVGKTTSIGKLANYYSKQGKKVLLAAGDTFRAAAASQLNQWAERSNVDIVICDTAGRLHNKKNLMAELSKISRVIRKASENASVETLLVLEAITGQNAIFQAKEFISAAEATGIILTKLDGTAKGGSVISIKKKLGIPVRFVGVGEGVDDLLLFDPQSFAETLFSLEDGE